MVRGSGDRGPANDGPTSGGQTDTTKFEYLGVGCFSAFVGFAGGGMIAVLIAKIAGALSRCAPEQETGAPCSWYSWAVWGAILGLVIVPVVSLWLFRRGRARANSDRR